MQSIKLEKINKKQSHGCAGKALVNICPQLWERISLKLFLKAFRNQSGSSKLRYG
jgi:hypothetical protein